MPDRRHNDDDEDDDRPRRRREDDAFEEEDDGPRPRRKSRPRDDEDDERRPRRPSRARDDEDDEPRPRRRSRASDDFDDDDFPDEPRSRRRRESPERLRSIAVRQKVLIICIALYLAAAVAQFFIPDDLRLIVAIPGAIVVLSAVVLVFLLAMELHGPGLGILFGFLTLIPCLGLIVLLIVNQQATSLLQRNKVRVGLFGARMSDIR